MKLKKKTFLLVFMMLFLFGLNFNKSLATDLTDMKDVSRYNLKEVTKANSVFNTLSFSKVTPITLKIKESNYKTNNGKVYWSIQESNGDNDYDFYCLNLSRGFGAPDGNISSNNTKEYKNTIEASDSNFNTYTGISDEIKNKILWILDQTPSKENINELLEKASSKLTKEECGTKYDFVKADMIENTRESTKLSFDDIKIIEQIAIWNYTNPESVFKNTIEAICDNNGDQISGKMDENIDTDGYGTYAWNGTILQFKINAIYRYFVDGANEVSSTYEQKIPEVSIGNENVAVVEKDESFIVGPFELNAKNAEVISNIQAEVTPSSYVLLDSKENEVENNNFEKVLGQSFYIKINKNTISSTTNLNIKIKVKYSIRNIEFLTNTDDYMNTQPVALVRKEDKEIDLNATKKIEMTEIKVEKKWEDANDQDGKRPSSIEVQLYKNEKAFGDVIVLNEKNKWNYTWSKLLGKNEEYSVKELDSNGKVVSNGGKLNNDYIADYVTEGTKTIITNTHIPEKVNKTVNKSWNDANNQDGKRPSQVIINLLKKVDGVVQSTNKTAVLSDANGWKYTFEDLDKYEDGKEIEYIVKEEIPNEYTTNEQEKSFKTVDEVTIINNYMPGTVNKTVNKIWDDEDNTDGSRPETVTVQLFKNGIPEGNPVELNKENNWTHTWIGLPEKQNGEKIIYTVKEVKVGDTDVSQNNDAKGYTVSYSSDNFNDTNEITITNKHVPEKINKTVKKIWADSEDRDKLRPKNIKVQLFNNDNQKVGEPIILSETNNWSYEWKNLQKQKDGKEITYIVKELNENNEPVENGDLYNANYTTTYSEDTFTITNTHKAIDLALRKFIIAVNDKEIMDSNGEYSREPKVDLSTLANGTAEYKHKKDPVSVEVGDIVTYIIRVYNEGDQDAYVSEITDNLPEYLEFVSDDETNKKYLWEYVDESEKKLLTQVTSMDSATGESLYMNRQNGQLISGHQDGKELDYIDVKIRCKVVENVPANSILTNIAEITGMQDEKGTTIENDRDSTVKNATLSEDLSNYKGNSQNKEELSDSDYYYKGQEDDDDFEKVIVQKFDLSLKKFITQVNNTLVSNREPQVDASKLGTINELTGKEITDATYKLNKTPIKVKKGDLVTYTIRIYNEGSLAGFANEITENIPEGLQFVSYKDGDGSINDTYKWKMLDKDQNEVSTTRNAVFLTTDYLTDKEIPAVTEEEETKIVSYKDVQIQFEVKLDPEKFKDNIIKNVAQISEESNKDIDSTPSRTGKYNYSGINEDDIDYEPIKVVYFNLALRKFVTKVDETPYNNRYPEIIFNEDGSIKYNHTKDPVDVITGATVVYTIRIYNEGTLAGFAEEVIDDLPEGLEFLPDNEINKEYKWKMLDKNGNVTTNIITAKSISTNYLSSADPSNIIDAIKIENGQKIVGYKDIKIAFKVTEKEMSDRLLINIATIKKTSEIDIDESDDSDKEYVKIQNFDLALKKWLTKTIITYNGKTTTKETGFNENSTDIAKVDIVGKQAKKTDVKFVYKIKVINEGKIAGYATEVKDYIPKGLELSEEDSKDWKIDKDGNAVTTALANTLLQPGESATVEITLKWKKSTSNMGVKTNYAEISEDSGDDIDSTPNNFDLKEDDIDNAEVVISIKTGAAKTYILLATVVIVILGAGTYCIKKYVID